LSTPQTGQDHPSQNGSWSFPRGKGAPLAVLGDGHRLAVLSTDSS
jgi:hypothetical protein